MYKLEGDCVMATNELDYTRIGQRIRQARIALGWQQAELAYRTGLNGSYISHIETGQTKLALPTLVKIANALSVSVDALLCDSLKLSRHVYDQRFAEEFRDCDNAELQAFLEIIQSTKRALRKKRSTLD